MFEEAINELENMGLNYTETEDGTLVIDISDADKTDVVTVVSFLNDRAMSYTIDADAITVTMPMGDAPVAEDTMMDPAAMSDYF